MGQSHQSITHYSSNLVLAALPAEDINLLLPHLRTVELPQEMVLFEAGDAISRVLFPHGGVVSLVVELASGGIVIWNVRRDSAGTPRVEQLPKVTWGRLSGEDGSLTQDLLRDVILAGTPSAAMAVRTAPGGLDVSRAMGLLEAILPETTLFDCFGGLGDLIMDVAAGSALAKWYELVVVRRSRSGELTLGGCQLFPTGAQRGDRWPFTVTCEPGRSLEDGLGGTVERMTGLM